MSDEVYVGQAKVTSLGETDKIGVFGEVRMEEVVDKIVNTDPNQETLKIKILPMKEERNGNTHSIKLE